MWLVVGREPVADKAYWPGRQLLAVLDAVGWPLLWGLVALRMPVPVGVVRPMIAGLAVIVALRRVHRAVFLNHRYRFATWRWGKVVVAMLLIGAVMKLVMVR